MANPTTAIATTNDFYNVAKELEAKETKEKEEKRTVATGTKTGTNVYTYPSYGSYGKYNTGKYTTYTPKYTYTGNLNKTDFPEFVNICKMSQKKLKQYLCGKMKEIYPETTFIGDGYIFCKGEIPVLLTAHMDTVHDKLISNFYEDVQTDKNGKVTHKISSPQGIGGDDRCGIYEILTVLEDGYRPYILFCEDEEIGGVGSAKFCKTEYIKDLLDLKFLIELDRANANDLVFYSNDNRKFIEWIEDETNWKIAWGSFSDICNLSPECGVSSVNLSCGYYNAHTLGEYVIVEEMLEAIKIVEHLLEASEEIKESFEYIKKKYTGYYGYSDYGYGFGTYSRYNNRNNTANYRNYNNWDEDYDYDDYDDYCYHKVLASSEKVLMEFNFIEYYEDGTEKEVNDFIEGVSEADCWKSFFEKNPYTCYNDILDWTKY